MTFTFKHEYNNSERPNAFTVATPRFFPQSLLEQQCLEGWTQTCRRARENDIYKGKNYILIVLIYLNYLSSYIT